MAKYAPHLRALAPNAALLTPGYSATEGAIGIAASLLEAVRPLPPRCKSSSAAANGASELAAAGEGGSAAATQPAADPSEEAFVLLPHIGCFYELLDVEGGETFR